jgi:hypothetical protein
MYPIEKYNFVVYDKKNIDGTVSKNVVALSTYCGKVIKGIAKCSSGDEFDLEKGKKLAAARCDLKVCQKRAKRAKMKRIEALNQFSRAGDYYNKMENYYKDSLKESLDSLQRLSELEEAYSK